MPTGNTGKFARCEHSALRKDGRIGYLAERLKDWVAQLLKALSSGRGWGEGELKWRKSLFNPPHPNLLPLEKEQSYRTM
jgi:hypothetical protein